MMKGKQGFSLVELLVAIAITGLVVSGLGTAIYQIITVPEYGNDKLTATHEVQNVAHWFNLDGQRASAASGDSELVLTLPDESSISYNLVGTELYRNTGSSNMILARNISSADFSVADRTITMTITSAPAGRWQVIESSTYQVCRRPASK